MRRLLGLGTLGIAMNMAPFAPGAGSHGDPSLPLPFLPLGILAIAWQALPSSSLLSLVLKWPTLYLNSLLASVLLTSLPRSSRCLSLGHLRRLACFESARAISGDSCSFLPVLGFSVSCQFTYNYAPEALSPTA